MTSFAPRDDNEWRAYPNGDTVAVMTPVTPFYAAHPCATCRHEIGADGVWVTEEQKWCRRCAVLLSGLLNSVLGEGR